MTCLLMHLLHKKCREYGIVYNNEQIFNYLSSFEEKNVTQTKKTELIRKQ